jgi:hypothetical protein
MAMMRANNWCDLTLRYVISRTLLTKDRFISDERFKFQIYFSERLGNWEIGKECFQGFTISLY